MQVNFDTLQGGDLPGTVARVNRVLRQLGVEERIVQGRGYVYFAEGDAYSWYSSSVPINHISQMTVRQLIEEYVRLKNEGDESSKDRQVMLDDGRYRIRRSQTSTTSGNNMNSQLIQAAKQRISAQSEDWKSMMEELPGNVKKFIQSLSRIVSVQDILTDAYVNEQGDQYGCEIHFLPKTRSSVAFSTQALNAGDLKSLASLMSTTLECEIVLGENNQLIMAVSWS